jgi:hypothetical protein
MPVAPLAVALVGMALARATTGGEIASCRARVALALALTAWSALVAVLLWRDPIAANDSAVLLAKSTYADGNQYLPNLFIRHWTDGAPGLWARIAAWSALGALAPLALRRARSANRLLAGLAAAILLLGAGLERWPGTRTAPVPPNVLAADEATRVFFDGAARVRGEEAVLGPGSVDLLLRRTGQTAPEALRAVVGGAGQFRAAGRAPFALRPTGGLVDLPLAGYHVVRGKDGRDVAFARTSIEVSGQAVMRLRGGEGEILSVPVEVSLPVQPAGEGDRGNQKEPAGGGLR